MNDVTPPSPNEPTYVVGVGASAGGLESLERFFGALPAGTGMAFVVIQHLAPDHKSLMSELLRKHTQMPVEPATHGAIVDRDSVYLIPPGHNLEIRERKLVLTQRMDHPHRRPNYAVDQFFRSLALECAERAVGVVLSGTGSDGSHGCLAIKAAGGLALAEDPETAKFGSMPRSAIDTGAVTAVLPAGRLPAEILRHVGLLEVEAVQPKAGLERILSLVGDHSGINFEAYKRTTVGRRVERRRITTNSPHLEAYAQLLADSATERTTLSLDLLVGVTAFFRDPEAFTALASHLPPLIHEAAERRDRTLRVWVPACSTGEEAYTMAILCHEVVAAMQKAVTVKIFATDVNEESLAIAGRARYPFSISANVDPELLNRYFSAELDTFVARPFLRESIVFARHDILRDPPFTRVDLLSCRNMLIYFAADAQQRTMNVFNFALRPGGVLMLGSSETLGPDLEHFRTLDERSRVYQMGAPSLAPHALASELHTPDTSPAKADRKRPVLGTSTPDTGGVLLEGMLNWLGVPALILNQHGDLAYAFGRAAGQLRVPVGRAAWKAMDLLPTEMAVLVSAAVDQVKTTREEVLIEGASVVTHDGPERTNVRAIPLGPTHPEPLGTGLLFEDWDNEPSQNVSSQLSVDQAVRSRVQQLEVELERTSAKLQTTVEELEASNEELQATNEELVSSNEELQSTNEELQSLNEELHTVNAELQSKVEELSILSADLSNLLRTIGSGLLFLDLKGRVRRFNEKILNIIPLVAHDEGRPIKDIAHRLAGIDLGLEVGRVIDSAIGSQREVLSTEGRVYALALEPFRTEDQDMQGVVVTANDVTSLSDVNARLQVYSRLVDQSPALHVIADAHGCIQYANSAYSNATGLRPGDLKGVDLRGVLAEKTTEDVGKAVRSALDAGAPWAGHVWLKTASSIPLRVRTAIHPVRNADGVITHIAQTAQPVDGSSEL